MDTIDSRVDEQSLDILISKISPSSSYILAKRTPVLTTSVLHGLA